MKVTIKDIAKSLGISYTTVSRALNNNSEISDTTKRKVKNTAESMGYFPNEIARGLVKNNTRTLGIIIQDISNPYFADIVHGIEDYANERGFTTFLGNSSWNIKKENDYIRVFLSKRVDGLIINPVTSKTLQVIRDMNLNTPVVFVNAIDKTKQFNCVGIDNEQAARIATEYLIDLRHSNIFFVGGNENIADINDRIIGYSKAMKENGLTTRIYTFSVPSLTRESGKAIAMQLIKIQPFPSAIIAANDEVALGLIEVLEDYNFFVPDNISIIGFDNNDITSLSKINLTTIDQPKYKMGFLSAEILLNNILKKEKDVPPQQIILKPSLIVRGSVKANRENK